MKELRREERCIERDVADVDGCAVVIATQSQFKD